MASGNRRLEPRRRPRQARAELTRGRILDAAAHVFAEHGYAAGTTNRIAEAARISIGSLYQYFPNKDAILAELLVRHIDDGARASAEQSERALAAGSLEAAVRLVVREAIETHRADPQLLRIMIEEAPRSADLVEKVGRHEESRIAQFGELLARHPEVRVDDIDTAAVLLASTVELVTHQLMAAPARVDIERFERELVGMLVRYLAGDLPYGRTDSSGTPDDKSEPE
ncbi:TetR/AcrR family transcriptional regulator [Streptomyces marokkonensis]|uniref:TetR/AcrR family transcriptional regulator n=1 Tax=Streptomyces marokkonensis TaxID=324855 RepID=A0ABW6QEB5_9ACTN